MARAQQLGVDIDVEVSESPTQEEPASGYQAGQANAAAGKERSMGMNLGGEKAAMKQTAGGQDIEEGYGDAGMNKYGLAAVNKGGKFYSYKDGKETGGPFDTMDELAAHQQELIQSESVGKTAGGSDVEEGMDSFVNPNDQDGTDNEKAVDPMAQDDLEDDDLDENREMAELLRLAGQQNEVEETQDVDTGKQALKAERDPMLERMLNLVNR